MIDGRYYHIYHEAIHFGPIKTKVIRYNILMRRWLAKTRHLPTIRWLQLEHFLNLSIENIHDGEGACPISSMFCSIARANWNLRRFWITCQSPNRITIRKAVNGNRLLKWWPNQGFLLCGTNANTILGWFVHRIMWMHCVNISRLPCNVMRTNFSVSN